MDGKELKEVRESLGLTQAELARVLGYTEHTIANLERGRKQITEHFQKQLLNEVKVRMIRGILDSD